MFVDSLWVTLKESPCTYIIHGVYTFIGPLTNRQNINCSFAGR